MPNNVFSNYGTLYPYKKYEVVYLSTNTPTLLYSTIDNNSNNIPLNKPYFTTTEYTRQDNLLTNYFTPTGIFPEFTRGSLIQTEGYTGMVLHGGPGFVQYLSAGPDITIPQLGGYSLQGILNPAWTTGFFFVPSYTSSLENNSQVIEAQLGDDYSQRMRQSLNNNINMWKLSFMGRSDRETLAIQTFIEDKGGVDAFKLLMPISKLTNNPNLKYISKTFNYSTQFYNSNDSSVDVVQVFDIQ